MAKYMSYTHIQNINKSDCEGILNNSYCSVTSKIDGTSALVFFDGKEIQCGSRSRQLSETKDNAGFYK